MIKKICFENYKADKIWLDVYSYNKKASKYISSIDGYLNHKLKRCLEQSNKYILLVEWNKLEDHTIGFRESEQYKRWKEILHHYYDPFPAFEHFETTFEMKNNNS